MSQAKSSSGTIGNGPALGLAQQTLTPEQQDLALRKIQDQSDKRTKLGYELFRATEAQTTRQQAAIDLLHAEHQELGMRLDGEIKHFRHEIDQKLSSLDERLVKTSEALERKVESLQKNWSVVEKQIAELITRMTNVVESSNRLLQRPTPRPEMDVRIQAEEDLDTHLPMTAASMPTRRSQQPVPHQKVSTPTPPINPDTQDIYHNALQRIRSHRARPADY